jgi:ATP-binding cassette subfamily B protein
VALAASGADAVDQLERTVPAQWPGIVVCDIALGEEDGHQIVRRIRQIEQQRGVPLDDRVPAVALTGLAQAGDRIRALMAGFQVHLAKPVEPQELVSTLAALAGRPGTGNTGGQSAAAA